MRGAGLALLVWADAAPSARRGNACGRKHSMTAWPNVCVCRLCVSRPSARRSGRGRVDTREAGEHLALRFRSLSGRLENQDAPARSQRRPPPAPAAASSCPGTARMSSGPPVRASTCRSLHSRCCRSNTRARRRPSKARLHPPAPLPPGSAQRHRTSTRRYPVPGRHLREPLSEHIHRLRRHRVAGNPREPPRTLVFASGGRVVQDRPRRCSAGAPWTHRYGEKRHRFTTGSAKPASAW